MTVREFSERICLNLPFVPNGQQADLVVALARFCSPETPDGSVFLLNGYAGTGKTSVTGALVKTLRELRIPVVLMAPTGRAAKVFGSFAGCTAWTIHRRIYRPPVDGGYFGIMNENPLVDAVYIVDEASMIGCGVEGRENLLEDLVHYVYSGIGCRMILLGDTAQLPPVGTSGSPAMDVKVLRQFGLRVTHAVLTKVVRQGARSGILYNATWLRRAMKMAELPEVQMRVSGFRDISAISSEEMEEVMTDAYSDGGVDNTIVITRSNKRATGFNLAIRSLILNLEEELCVGERLLVSKNNYYWCAGVKGISFIANGDVAVVEQVYGTENRYGLRFADVRLSLVDKEVEIDCKIMLDPLTSDSAGLDAESANAFMERVLLDPELFTADMTMNTRYRMLHRNPYYNALQVKYGYAVTCHKSQGGQWNNVFVDMGYIAPDGRGLDFYRWLYTACTRAKSKLVLVNPDIRIV